MSGPWEDYGGTSTATEEGPWNDFSVAPENAPSIQPVRPATEALTLPPSPITGLVSGIPQAYTQRQAQEQQKREEEASKSLIGISPEMVPAGTTPATSLISAVGKTGAGLGQWATSPSGIAQQALTLNPYTAPAIGAKWLYDMAKGVIEEGGNAVQELGNLLTDRISRGVISANALPPPPQGTLPGSQEHIQALSEHLVGAGAQLLGVAGLAKHLPAQIKSAYRTAIPKGTPDAIQERGTAPLPVDARAEVGQEVGTRVPQPEEAPIPQEAQVQAKAPEVVTAATYTDPKTGETTTAPNHIEAAAEQGVEAPKPREERNTPEYGFEVQDTATGKTEVVSRNKAEEVARESGQLKEEPKGEKVHSDEIDLAPAKPTEAVASPTVAASTPTHIDVEKAKGGEQVIRDLWSGMTRTPAVKGWIRDIEDNMSFIADLPVDEARQEISKAKSVWSKELESLKRIEAGKAEPNEKQMQNLRYWEGRQGKVIDPYTWATDYGIPEAERMLSSFDKADTALNKLLKRATPKPTPKEEEPPPAPPSAKGTEVVPAKSGEVMKPFEVDDKLIMRSPHTGEDTIVNYRGKPSSGQAMVWTGKSQFQVPESWLRRQGEKYVNPLTDIPVGSGGGTVPTVAVPSVSSGEGAAPIEPVSKLSKSKLIDELVGPKMSYETTSQWEARKRKYASFTKPELSTRVDSKRQSQARELKIKQYLTPISEQIESGARQAGSQWRAYLRGIAEREQVRFNPPADSTRGDMVYGLSRAIAEKRLRSGSSSQLSKELSIEPKPPTTTPSTGEGIAGGLVPPPTGPETGELAGGAAYAGEIPETGRGGEIYGASQARREERAKAGQVVEVKPGVGINPQEAHARGIQLLDQGFDAPAALEKMKRGEGVTADASMAINAYGERLAAGARTIEEQFGTDSPQYREAFKKLSDWDTKSKSIGTEAHKLMVSLQGETDLDTGSFTGLNRYRHEITGEDFSKTEKPVAEKKAKQIKTLSDDLTQARTRLYDEMEKGGPISVAEKRALDAANRTVRENAIRLANLETKRRVADQARQTALDKAKQEADAKIAKAQTDAARNAAIKAAKAETDKRVAVAARAKAVEDVRIKAAQNALEAAQKRARDAAVKMAEAERKAQADPMRRVWNKVKEYIDRNSGKFTESFDDLRTKVAADLGMKVEQVTRLMAQDPRVKYLTDDLWRKQQQLRVMKEQAKRWVQNLSKPWIQKALESLPRALFRLKVGFHGTVALGTHAPMVAFQPRFWGTYIRDFGKMYELVGIKGLKHAQAYYEQQVQDLMRRPNYVTARRAGLVNDPFTYEDFNTPITAKYFGNLTGMGNRGYTILKILRQDMFDQMWNNLPKQSQIPEIAQAIADGLNHATGVVKGAAPKGSNIALFAPRLEASRVMWLAGDPIRAANTFLNWKKASLGEREFAMNQVKEKLWVAGTFFSMLALNQGFLNATGSKQKINGIPESLGGGGMNPFRSDFLKFKAAGMTESYGNPMLTMARLPLRLWVGLENEGKLNKIIHEDENTAKTLFDYARSQASPFAGLTLDLAFGRDFQQRPLPRAGFGFLPERKGMPKRLKEEGITKPYTWAEFAVEQGSPIPFQEAVREVWGKGLGMSEADIKRYSKALAVLTLQAGTGARIGEDYYANPKPQTSYYVP